MLAIALLAAAASLDGHWASACLAMGRNGRHGTIFRLAIAHDTIEMVGKTYAHATCDTPTIETRLTARLDHVVERDHRIEAILTVDDVTMTPEAPDVVAIWNRGQSPGQCAAATWQLAESQSVAGGACVAGHRFPDRGARLVVHAARQGDALRLPYPLPGSGGAPIVLTRTQ